nr:MAG TPA: NTP-PPase-like protein [Caudoviricetes sp.]
MNENTMKNCKEYEDISATIEKLKNTINKLANSIGEFGDYIKEFMNETDSYTDLALKTLNKDVFEQKDLILNASLGLSGEVGEVNDIIKKYMYHGHKLDDDMKEKIILELGDVCWYVALMAWAIDKTKFEDVLNKNIAKLEKRYHGEFSTEKSINRKEDSDNSCEEKKNDCEFEFETTLSDEEWRKLLGYCENDVAAQEEYYVRQSKEDEEKKEDTKKTSDDTKTNNDLSVEDLLDEYYNARRFGDFINLLFGKKDSKKPCEEKKDNSDSLLDKFNKYYNKDLSIEDMFDLYYMPYLR